MAIVFITKIVKIFLRQEIGKLWSLPKMELLGSCQKNEGEKKKISTARFFTSTGFVGGPAFSPGGFSHRL